MYMMGGISLLERTVRLAARCPRLDRTLVSTDSPDMHALAERFGVASPALRPAHLASSSARSAAVVADLVECAGIPPGWLLPFQIGQASGRERGFPVVYLSVVAVSLKT